MTFEKDLVTIHLEGSDVEAFWHLIMFALDYNAIAKNSEPGTYSLLTKEQLDLANKLEEIVRPSNG